MKVTFVCPGDELLGIGYMSAVLKQHNIETDLVFDPRLLQDSIFGRTFLTRYLTLDSEFLVNRIIETKPDLVAFTATTNTILWAFEVASKLKKAAGHIPIIFGGPHVTAVPERVIRRDFVDFICVGPGEYALLKLAQSIQAGDGYDIPGIWHKRGSQVKRHDRIYQVEDLDQVPFPDKELFYSQLPFYKNPYVIVSSRGCPFNCTYCLQSMYHKLYRKCGAKPYQRRSVSNVIQELVMAKKRWGIKSVKFFDDLFAYNKRWLREFCEEYKRKIDLPFRCSLHPHVVDAEILDLLKYAGAYTLTVGVESVNERILRDVLNRKGSYERMQRSLELMRKSKMYFSVDHIFGLPDESEEDHKKAAQLYTHVRPNNILLYWLVYYPKTEIIKHGLERKLIEQSDIELIEEGKGHISYKYAHHEGYQEAYPYYVLFNLISIRIIPKFVFAFILKHNLLKVFKLPMFIVALKQLFDSLDPRSSRNEQLNKTRHLFKYVLAMRRRKPVRGKGLA